MRRGSRAIAALLLAAASGAAPAAERFDERRIEALLVRHAEVERRAPGLVVGLLDADGARVLARGVSGNPARPALDGDTLFEIGSITKTLTGVLLVDLVARGEARLDEPAGPIGDVVLPAPQAAITLEALATHHAGLPRLALSGAALGRLLFRRSDPYAGATPAEIDAAIAALDREALARRAGTMHYSNLGYAWLGQVLALRLGKSYGTALGERVLRPLGIEHAYLEVPPEHAARLARGHRDDGRPARAWRLDAYDPAGGIKASAHALLAYLGAIAGGRHAALAASLEPHATRGEGRSVGLGWLRSPLGSDTLIAHSGGTGGFRSFIGWVPERQVGLVVLANSALDVDALALALLDPARAYAPPAPESRLGLTAAMLVAALVTGLGALLVFARARLPAGADRLRLVIAAAGVALLLAVAWAVGDFRVLPFGLWYAVLAVALGCLVFAAIGARRAPWLARRGAWRVGLRLASLALYLALTAMMLG